MRFDFLTFADSRLQRSLNRIKKQASELGCYRNIHAMTELHLESQFKQKFADKLVPGSRGYGYWCWKPQIILQVLKSLESGDVLQYTDAGCHLNKAGLPRLKEYVELVTSADSGVLAFQAKPPEPPLQYDGRKLTNNVEYPWVKGDLLDYFGVRNELSIVDTYTVGAGVIFFRQCKSSVAIVEEWLHVIHHDFSLLDDTPSRRPNLPGFIEHRHDQAIFSLIAKKHNLPTLSAYEYWYPRPDSSKPDWRALDTFPIHAKRDMDFGFTGNALQLARRIYRKGMSSIRQIATKATSRNV